MGHMKNNCFEIASQRPTLLQFVYHDCDCENECGHVGTRTTASRVWVLVHCVLAARNVSYSGPALLAEVVTVTMRW